MSNTFNTLNSIIDEKKIKTVFQPIVSLRDGSILGHEALSRIKDTSLELNIEDLFGLSEIYNRMWDLEFLCRTTALETAFLTMKPPYAAKLFLNVNPNIMHDIKFKQGFTKEYLEQYGITPDQIIFEITERNAIKDMNGFLATIAHYKDQNYKIAIDDAGAGYSGLNLISDIKPHFIKIDMNLVHNINADSMKYALVKSMIELSNISHIYLIAEGIETYEELKTLIGLGVQYGQGYYLQRPNEIIKEIPQNILSDINEVNRKKNHANGYQASTIYIDNLCSTAISVSPNISVEQVYDLLSKNIEYQGICVTQNDEVVGVVMRNKLILQMSGRYGFTLNQHKMISSIMDTKFLCVDYQTPISTVSQIATLRDDDNMYDFIVITKENKLVGTVTIKALLQKITETELLSAKYQNPLSGLPGNIEIEGKLISCIESKSNTSVLYIDIDNFKAYNDVYGFEKGDLIIKSVAETLRFYVPESQFIGHIGGDDFIIIAQIADVEKLCMNILEKFQESVAKYYNETDLQNGYIIAHNRHGVVEQFSLLSLTIAGTVDVSAGFSDMYSMSESLAQIKKEIKQSGGNKYKLI